MSHKSGKKELEHNSSVSSERFSTSLVLTVGRGVTSLGVIESPELLESSGMGSSLALYCNIRSFVIELDYGYQYLLEVCSELSDICFMICVGILQCHE